MSIARIGEFHAQAGQEAALRTFILTYVVPAIRDSPGCESCHAWQSDDDPRRFTIIEVWASQDAHRASVRQIPPEQIQQVRTLIAGAPSGGYYHPLD
jgi:quinol monooxygenase YgiN